MPYLAACPESTCFARIAADFTLRSCSVAGYVPTPASVAPNAPFHHVSSFSWPLECSPVGEKKQPKAGFGESERNSPSPLHTVIPSLGIPLLPTLFVYWLEWSLPAKQPPPLPETHPSESASSRSFILFLRSHN